MEESLAGTEKLARAQETNRNAGIVFRLHSLCRRYGGASAHHERWNAEAIELVHYLENQCAPSDARAQPF